MQLSAENKKDLLEYARRVLVGIVTDGTSIDEDCPDASYNQSAGVFVSLHKDGELRGCIGYIEPVSTIWDAVRDNAIAAATRDHRFDHVVPEELAQIKIEISILTPNKLCPIDEIETGKHGVVLQQGGRKATYLPQVWNELPDRETFFSTLCEKAGLPADCWHDSKTKFYKYEAIIFSE
jgi:AmmeMemoRadiSam system protein A